MVISALGKDPVRQWWPACPRKQRILVVGMISSANFSNNKMCTVAFKRKTQVRLDWQQSQKLSKRSWVYLSCRNLSFLHLSCRKLSCLHNKPLGVEARDWPADTDLMMLSVTWTRFAEKIPLMCLWDSYSEISCHGPGGRLSMALTLYHSECWNLCSQEQP